MRRAGEGVGEGGAAVRVERRCFGGGVAERETAAGESLRAERVEESGSSSWEEKEERAPW